MSLAPLALSFQIAVLAALVAGVLGTGLAGLLARGRFLGRDVIDVLVSAPLVLPPTVLGYGLLLALGRDSVVGQVFESVTGAPFVFSRGAAVLAGVLAAFPFVVKGARAAMEDVDERLVAAAATLGASPLRVFLTVIVPLSRGGIVAGVSLGFARAVGEFGVTLMIAGNIPGHTQTGALAIYDAVQAGRDGDALGMVLVMAACAFAALTLATRLTRRRPHAW
jgi:molybdate transport system permease protein